MRTSHELWVSCMHSGSELQARMRPVGLNQDQNDSTWFYVPAYVPADMGLCGSTPVSARPGHMWRDAVGQASLPDNGDWAVTRLTG